MTRVLIKTDSHYKVDRKRIRKVIAEFLLAKKVRLKSEISISIVGNRQMRNLNKKYRNINGLTDVLSFPLLTTDNNGKFIEPPDDILRLGDIIISYPQVIEEASQEEKLVDDKIDELVLHGMKHLLGEEKD